jgi:hypothetical protein
LLKDHQIQALADLYARWRWRVGEVVAAYLDPPPLDNWPQLEAWNIRLRNAEASIGELWDLPCRSGKTRAALSALYWWSSWLREWGVPDALQRQWAYPHLVLVPSDLVRDGPWPADWAEVVPPWDERISTWKPGQPIETFHGGLWLIPSLEEDRVRAILARLRPGDVAVLTYPTLSCRQDIIAAQKWQIVVADEVHRLKDPHADWTQAAYRLQSVGRLGLSATPFTNYVHELREVLAFLQGWTWGGQRNSWIWPPTNVWKNNYCAWQMVPPQKGWKWRKVPAGALYPDYLYHKLRAEVMFSATTKEVSDAPEPIIHPLPITLSARQQGVYEQLKRGVLRWVNDHGRAEVFDTGPILAQLSYLFQLCADARQLEIAIAKNQGADNILSHTDIEPNFAKGWSLVDQNSKLRALLWVVDKGEQVLVLTGFAQLARTLAADLQRLGYKAEAITGAVTGEDRAGIVSRFKCGTTQVVLCTRAAWEGISLQASYAVLLGFVDHTPGIVRQALLRAWNMDGGQVEVYDCYAPGTVEEWNRERLAAKDRFSSVLTNGREGATFTSVADLQQAMEGVYAVN